MGFPLPSVSSSAALTAAQTQEDEKLWTRILSEVSSKSSSTFQGGTLIILGDNQSGKSSLLARLRKKRQPMLTNWVPPVDSVQLKTSAYRYGCWMAKSALRPLIQYALPLPSPAKTVVLLVASLDNPSLIHSIRRWANIFTQQVIQKYDKNAITEAKASQERFWQEYVEPVESSMTSSMAPGGLDDGSLLPLEHGVLSENCGASFVVVITKSDLCVDLTDVQADRILVQVRRLCLQLGAALIYTSAKNIKNIQILYKYVVHRAFGFPFTNTAQLIERDSVFVPAGWDGDKKIEIVRESIPDADTVLEPTREKPTIAREQLIEAEDEQGFLQRLAAAENAAPAAHKKATLLDDADNKTPLSSFFSNLLKDKPNAAKTAQPPPDTALQLDRILKSATGQQSQTSNEGTA
ncbi:hypothetical protein KIN20_037368 [Parelaphostrongylus tenuis]|uniref:Dynein light intermediate chain n=1 Tax=Parelaphostrongylus tenuis TaxID=148309 RepID=A0AAD5REA5_PARTN|nr:hypothetical protein KIN20_037368 [Parelaphostrongylus tenuis]